MIRAGQAIAKQAGQGDRGAGVGLMQCRKIWVPFDSKSIGNQNAKATSVFHGECSDFALRKNGHMVGAEIARHEVIEFAIVRSGPMDRIDIQPS